MRPLLVIATGLLSLTLLGCRGDHSEVEQLRAEVIAQGHAIDALKSATPPTMAVVVNKANKQGEAKSFGSQMMWSYCITYQIAGSTQESCRPFFTLPSNGVEIFPGFAAQGQAIIQCWTPIKVGDAIPECWQIGSPTTDIR